MALRHSGLNLFITIPHLKPCKLEPYFNTAHRVYVYQLDCVCLLAIEHPKLNPIRPLSSPTRSLGNVRLDNSSEMPSGPRFLLAALPSFECGLGLTVATVPLHLSAWVHVSGGRRWAKGQKRLPVCCLLHNVPKTLLNDFCLNFTDQNWIVLSAQIQENLGKWVL